ncbi:MAG: sigma-70 family RNA polymerase sigma factor [Pirellulales bacterium]|nr:sigma-70 family RNA polymerase sigma factor [Pirellulales bacterium]
MNQSHTSTTLLRRAQDGDNDAWRELERLYLPLIHYWCQKYNVDAKDIDEIKANVLGTASVQLGGFKHNGRQGAFRAWLRSVTRSEVYNFFRALDRHVAGRGGTTGVEFLAQAPEVSEEEASQEITILYQRAWELIRGEFSDRDNRIFQRAVENGEAPKDVAEDMGLLPHIVHQVVSRTKRRLRERLGDESAN